MDVQGASFEFLKKIRDLIFFFSERRQNKLRISDVPIFYFHSWVEKKKKHGKSKHDFSLLAHAQHAQAHVCLCQLSSFLF